MLEMANAVVLKNIFCKTDPILYRLTIIAAEIHTSISRTACGTVRFVSPLRNNIQVVCGRSIFFLQNLC